MFEASTLDEIIQNKLDPRRFERQDDFIDCVRLLADIIDSYPYEQQIVIFSKNTCLCLDSICLLQVSYVDFTRSTFPSCTNESFLM
jgi:hypothetical protein